MDLGIWRIWRDSLWRNGVWSLVRCSQSCYYVKRRLLFWPGLYGRSMQF